MGIDGFNRLKHGIMFDKNMKDVLITLIKDEASFNKRIIKIVDKHGLDKIRFIDGYTPVKYPTIVTTFVKERIPYCFLEYEVEDKFERITK